MVSRFNLCLCVCVCARFFGWPKTFFLTLSQKEKKEEPKAGDIRDSMRFQVFKNSSQRKKKKIHTYLSFFFSFHYETSHIYNIDRSYIYI